MSRTLYSLILAGLVLALVVGMTTAVIAAGKPRIIVAPISDRSVPESRGEKVETAAETVRNGLKDVLFKTGNFELIADEEMQKELDAQRWEQYASGDFDPSAVSEIGQKVGAQILAKCTVLRNQFWVEKKNVIIVDQYESIMQLSVALEICDITRGTVCHRETVEVQKSHKVTGFPDSKGGAPIVLGNAKDVRAQAVQEVVDKLKKVIEDIVQPAQILDAKDKTIVVALGGTRVQVGDKLSIVGKDEFGFFEEIGTAEVAATLPDKSKATIVNSTRPVTKDDFVSIAGGGGGTSSSGASSAAVTNGNGADTAAPAAETVTVVTASGQGTSKESAINAALLQAVQMVGGVYVMCEQEAKDYQMVKNEMFSKTDGFVTKYEEINSGKGDDGLTTATVKAWVSSKPVYDSLRAKQILGRQRVMVCVPETHLKLVVPDPAGETEIIKRLLDKNFRVVDQKISESIKKDEVNRELITKGDADKIVSLLANKRTADILICGEAFSAGAQRQTVGNSTKWTCEARVEVRAVNMDTAEILWTDSAHATAPGATEEVAGKAALKAAAKILCDGKGGEKGFVEKLLERVVANADTAHSVQCQVSGVKSTDDLAAVEDGLREVIGNRPLYRYSFQDGMALLNLETTKTTQDLVDSLRNVVLKGKLTVTGNSVNRIELAYAK